MTMVYVPPGLAHGFAVLSESADLLYKCTDYYHPNSERGIAWNDPALHIDWPETEVTLSEKDRQLPRLADQIRLDFQSEYKIGVTTYFGDLTELIDNLRKVVGRVGATRMIERKTTNEL